MLISDLYTTITTQINNIDVNNLNNSNFNIILLIGNLLNYKIFDYEEVKCFNTNDILINVTFVNLNSDKEIYLTYLDYNYTDTLHKLISLCKKYNCHEDINLDNILNYLNQEKYNYIIFDFLKLYFKDIFMKGSISSSLESIENNTQKHIDYIDKHGNVFILYNYDFNNI